MLPGIPVLPSEFEMQVRQLGLTPQAYVQSGELRRWCERNCNRCYIPEWLLTAWHLYEPAGAADLFGHQGQAQLTSTRFSEPARTARTPARA